MGSACSTFGDVNVVASWNGLFGGGKAGKVSPNDYSDYNRQNLTADTRNLKRRKRNMGIYLSNVAEHAKGLPCDSARANTTWGGTSPTGGMSHAEYKQKSEVFFGSDVQILNSRWRPDGQTRGGKNSGRSVASLTQAFISAQEDRVDKEGDEKPMLLSTLALLTAMKESLLNEEPHMQSSRPLDLESRYFSLEALDGRKERKHALIIGIDQPEPKGEDATTGTYHDRAALLRDHLVRFHDFDQTNVRFMSTFSGIDEETEAIGESNNATNVPTLNNVVDAFKHLVDRAIEGDQVFVGICAPQESRWKDLDGIPCHDNSGFLCDRHLYNVLLGPMRRGVFVTCILDCGINPIVEMPYQMARGEDSATFSMEINDRFSFLRMLESLKQACADDSEYKASETAMESILLAAKKTADAREKLFGSS